MEAFLIIVIGIIGALVCVIINQYKPEYTALVAIATGLVILLLLVPEISLIMEYINEIAQVGEIDLSYGKTIVKALGICIVTQLASDTCRDCGQSSIASKIELGGKVSVLAVSIPIFVSLIETVQELINL